MTKTQEQNWDSVLEGGEKLLAPKRVDVSILQQAKEYNIDLETLEIAPDKKQAAPKPENSMKFSPLFDMDVKLADMINLVFNRAEYPIFIVQDDVLMYINETAKQQLNLERNNLVGNPFLELVDKQDWNLLAENIGEMLTNHYHLPIRFALPNGNTTINLQAIYLPDIEHFSFILLGEARNKISKPSNGVLYDEKTGLPSFFLFEDRLQMALLAEHAIEQENEHKLIATIGINIDNIKEFDRLNLSQVVLKRIADNLTFNLPKTVTVAIGLKYHFWLLLSGLKNEFDLDFYLRRIKEILDAGIKDNFMHHDLSYSVGFCVFPKDAQTAKKMIEHTISAVRDAQTNKNNSIIAYNEKK